MPFIDPDSPTSNPFVGAPALTRPEMGFDISLDIIDIPSTGAVYSRLGHVSMCHVISHTGGGADIFYSFVCSAFCIRDKLSRKMGSHKVYLLANYYDTTHVTVCVPQLELA